MMWELMQSSQGRRRHHWPVRLDVGWLFALAYDGSRLADWLAMTGLTPAQPYCRPSLSPPEGIYFQVAFTEAVMPSQNRPEPHAKSFGENLESDLALEFLRIVENAAIASARTMGQGDRQLADKVATESMRQTMDTVPMRGTIVIGEGERDEAPMLYIGEQVGGTFPDGSHIPTVDIAVDPLEGTNLCATGAPGSITVLAASEKGGLLNAPDCYMEKIVVGPSCKDRSEEHTSELQSRLHLVCRLLLEKKKIIVKRLHRILTL